MDPTSTTKDQAATGELLTTSVGEQCASCQAPLASDQRYCVNCGERRGRSRFSHAAMAAHAAAPAPAAGPAPERQPRFSSATTLVAGVATLLLAMGVGVLIGNTSSNNQPIRASAPAVQVITTGGGGAVAGTRRAGKRVRVKAPKVKLTKKVLAAATASAGKVLGTSANLAPPTVSVGGACTHGAGCENGKFTGNFFAP